MPHANIWIRKENFERWEGIPDKSAWINDMLTGKTKISIVTKEDAKRIERAKPGDATHIGEVIRIPFNEDPANGGRITAGPKLFMDEASEYEFCKHGAVKGLCKKGCK